MPEPETEESETNELEKRMVEPEAPPAFALSPDQSHPEDTIDCTSSAGLKLYDVDAEELPMKFDCDSKNVGIFYEELIGRASESRWKSVGGNVL